MSEQKQTDERVFVFFLLIWAILFGGFVRIFPVLGSEMPMNDGGLFYAMARDIQAADFRLPVETTYNLAGIPFAYPPFALYFAALGDAVVPMLQIVKWLPPIVSMLTIIAFFFLSRVILKSDIQAGLATVAFAMLPAAYNLTITGGGLTRSFGFLFSILTLYFAYQLFQTTRRHYIFLTTLMAALLVMSHPVAMVHTLLSVFVFWLFWGRTRQATLSAVAVAVLTLLLTAPWWVTVISRHGIEPFLSAFRSGVDRLVFLVPLFRLDLGSERFLDFIMVLAILGFIVAISRRQYFLLLWILAIFVVGRDAQTAAMLPVAIAASLGLTEVVFKGIQAFEKITGNSTEGAGVSPNFLGWLEVSRGGKLILTFFLIYSVFNAFAYSLSISVRVTDQEQKALQWVEENTSPGARFLMLTYGDPLNTPLQEWFPALTGRVNLTVAQGYEWLPDQQFSQRLADFNLLQPCLTENWGCVESWVSERNHTYDYVYVYQGYVGRESVNETEPMLASWILDNLNASSDYVSVYQAPLITIFENKAE
jgi:hypothetical protein